MEKKDSIIVKEVNINLVKILNCIICGADSLEVNIRKEFHILKQRNGEENRQELSDEFQNLCTDLDTAETLRCLVSMINQ